MQRTYKSLIFFTDSFYPNRDATSKLNTDIVNYLSKNYLIKLLVINNKLKVKRIKKNIQFKKVSVLFPNSRKILPKLIKFVSLLLTFSIYTITTKTKDSIIVVNTSPPVLVFTICFLIKLKNYLFRNETKLLLLAHDIYPDLLEVLSSDIKSYWWYRSLNYIFEKSYRQYDYIIACCKAIETKLVNKYLVKKNNIIVINNWSLITSEKLKSFSCPFYDKVRKSKIRLIMIGNIGVVHNYKYTGNLINKILKECIFFDRFDLYLRGLNKKQFTKIVSASKKIKEFDFVSPDKLIEVYNQPTLTVVPITRKAADCAFPSRVITAISLGSPILVISDYRENNKLIEFVEENYIGFGITELNEVNDFLLLKHNLIKNFSYLQDNCLELYKEFSSEKGLDSIFKILESFI